MQGLPARRPSSTIASVGLFARLSRYLDDTLLLPDEAREHAEAARRHLDAGEAEEALQSASAALGVRPDHPQLLYLAGEALARLGERKEAEQMLREVLSLDDDHAPSRVALGRVLAESGRVDEAVVELRRGASQLVGSRETELASQALTDLADCHRRLGRPDRAARELRKAVALRPDDAQLHAALARALGADDEPRTARAAARRAVELVGGSRDLDLLAEVGRTALNAGLHEESVGLFRAATEHGADVHLDLGRALAASGDAMAAHEQALRALAVDAGAPGPHRLLSELALKAGDHAAALAALQAALSIEPDHLETLRRAVSSAARVDIVRAGPLAESLVDREPASPLGLAVRARASLAEGRSEGVAGVLAEVTVRAPEEAEAWLGLAELAIRSRHGEEALEALEHVEALDPSRPELDGLSSTACLLVVTSGSDAEPSLFDVLERVHGLLASRGELAELAVEVGRIREDYDRPLLLTVMGEFNAGKSTFINALVGEPVAPMGITPTTATINVLKYGPERKVRVLHTSGTVKEMAYEALGAWLKGLSRSAAVEVRQVEILYPAEELTRVNLVDTPGFNSIVPEHETVARQFIERADAVVWLFDAGQPGKDTERKALLSVTERGKRVLGVLNKADRLDETALAAVLEYVDKEGLGDLLEAVVPLSARRALDAKLGGGEGADLEGSGLPAVQEALDVRFYSRAREIKRAGCAERLVGVLAQAVERERAENGEVRRAVESLELLRRPLADLGPRVSSAAQGPAARGLGLVYDAVASEAAAEVLEFVRPRRHVLDSHRFSPEDRAHLVGLVEERLDSGLEPVRKELESAAAAAVGEIFDTLDDGAAGLVRLPTARQEATDFARSVTFSLLVYHRGLLRGGSADRFFEEELPRIDLEATPVARSITSWWMGQEAQVRSLVERGATELARSLDAHLATEAGRLRADLARRRRAGARPLSGFADLARRWTVTT